MPERFQAAFHVCVFRGVAPVFFGGEVDDEALPEGIPVQHGQDFADGQLSALASFSVHGEIVRIGFFELQGNALAHHPYGVDGVDQCPCRAVEQVAGNDSVS
jgi:hypothetical protein